MDLQEIVNDLNKRFNKPCSEFHKRRIIIWMDEEGEFEDAIDSIELDNVKILQIRANNKFAVKKILCFDDRESDYLLYCPLVFNTPEDNWIMDVCLYAEEFRADRISIEIAEMGLDISLRQEIKRYKKFFNAKKRRDKIGQLSEKIDSAGKLVLSIMSSIAGCDMAATDILRELIKAGLNNDNNSIYQDYINYKLEEAFWKLAYQATGYTEENREIGNLFRYILITASARHIDREVFIGFDRFINTAYETFCFQFIEDWIRDSQDRELFKKLSRNVEEELGLYERLKKIELDGYDRSEIFPAVDEAVLTELMTDIKNNIIEPDVLIAVTDKRRVMAWYEEFKFYYKAVYYMAKMKEFYNKYYNAFHEVEAKRIWESYVKEYYLMDTYYRKFQQAFQRSLIYSNARLDDLVKSLVSKAEWLYRYWFLDELLTNWCDAAKESLKNIGYIPGIKRQMNFYEDNIKDAKTKVFVIISDAMRYEVGVELSKDLRRDMQCKVEMKNMEGACPTITPFGMAALLPNNGLHVELKQDALKILIDGEYTDSTYREKILKKENNNSVVLKYNTLIQMKRGERKEKVRGMDVVYIYHDKIDSASHTSDDEVFTACEHAISELKNLVKIIVNEFSGINIMITSDHGFIYTYDEFDEEDKISSEGLQDAVEFGRRYAIMKNTSAPSFLMPIKFMDEKAGLRCFAPRENIRIKKQGGGVKFVHGGISLQEMVIPLIIYKHLRNDSKEYQRNKHKLDVKPVELKLLSSVRKISNMIFNMSFYQSEMLSENREAANFTLYFVDEYGSKVSDEVRIIADRQSPDNETDRRFDVRFNLKAGTYNSRDVYYLMIIEESGKLPSKKIEFSIDIPFSTDTYDFF